MVKVIKRELPGTAIRQTVLEGTKYGGDEYRYYRPGDQIVGEPGRE